MPPQQHIISTSKPKRILNYFLSLIGLDRFLINNDEYPFYDEQQQHGGAPYQQQSSSSSKQQPSAASSCSFLTASTLFVSHHNLNGDDDDDLKKQQQQQQHHAPPPDVWTLQSWISGLSKSVLCQIVWMAMMQYHDSTLWPELEEGLESQQDEKRQGRQQEQEQEDGILEELKTIQEQANQLAHRLDAMRPSEQFVHAAQVAQEFQQLIRLCVHLLHKNPLAATLGIMLIVQQSFGAPPEVRQHVYYQAKLGRLVVLELESILKYHQEEEGQQQRRQRQLRRKEQDQESGGHHANYLVSCVLKDLDASTMSDGGGDDWLGQLEQLCAKLSRYDTTWEFRQEYQNVVRLAEQFYAA